MDGLAGSGVLAEESVVMQVGHTTGFVPRFCEWRDFLDPAEFEARLRDAAVIVTHAGCGTLRQAIRLGKAPVVMPRLKRYGEHVNDHQLELLEAYNSAGLVVPALEQSDLSRAIAKARVRQTMPARLPETSEMVGLVAEAITELASARRRGWLATLCRR
jgi:UDP-N-acetylglucosamine transferase subunit ALG13